MRCTRCWTVVNTDCLSHVVVGDKDLCCYSLDRLAISQSKASLPAVCSLRTSPAPCRGGCFLPQNLDSRLIGSLMVRLGLRGCNRVSCGKYVDATIRARVEATAMSRSDGHWRLMVLEETRPLNCGQMCNNRRLRSRRELESSAVRKGPLSRGMTRVRYGTSS